MARWPPPWSGHAWAPPFLALRRTGAFGCGDERGRAARNAFRVKAGPDALPPARRSQPSLIQNPTAGRPGIGPNGLNENPVKQGRAYLPGGDSTTGAGVLVVAITLPKHQVITGVNPSVTTVGAAPSAALLNRRCLPRRAAEVGRGCRERYPIFGRVTGSRATARNASLRMAATACCGHTRPLSVYSNFGIPEHASCRSVGR